MAIDAVSNYSVGLQQTPKASLKSQQSFTSKPEVDEEKSNATKYMIGATALAAVIGLGIAGYKGKLGKGIQEFLGGAEKAVKDGAQNASESTGSASKPMTEGAEQATKKAEEVPSKAADVAEEVTTNVSEEIDKVNDYFKKNGVDGKAFIDNNNPEQVVVIKRDKDGYYKQVQSKKDFKFHDSSSSIDSDKNISSVVIDKSTPIHKVEKVAANGVKTTITRKQLKNGEVIVNTTVEKDGYSYYKSVRFDKDKNFIDSSEHIDMPTYLTPASSSTPGFAEAKKEVLAKLREGLNWSDEPIRKTPQA